MRIRPRIAAAAAAAVLTAPLADLHAAAVAFQGSVTGTLTVGTSTFQLTHAYAFPDKPDADATKATWRVLMIDKPLPAEAVRAAASAGIDDGDRQQLVLAIAEHEISGLELIVGADERVVRVNVYSPDAAMGLMLLQKGRFDATTLDGGTVAGKISTEAPIQDPRLGKAIEYEATFSAPIAGAAGR